MIQFWLPGFCGFSNDGKLKLKKNILFFIQNSLCQFVCQMWLWIRNLIKRTFLFFLQRFSLWNQREQANRAIKNNWIKNHCSSWIYWYWEFFSLDLMVQSWSWLGEIGGRWDAKIMIGLGRKDPGTNRWETIGWVGVDCAGNGAPNMEVRVFRKWVVKHLLWAVQRQRVATLSFQTLADFVLGNAALKLLQRTRSLYRQFRKNQEPEDELEKLLHTKGKPDKKETHVDEQKLIHQMVR